MACIWMGVGFLMPLRSSTCGRARLGCGMRGACDVEGNVRAGAARSGGHIRHAAAAKPLWQQAVQRGSMLLATLHLRPVLLLMQLTPSTAGGNFMSVKLGMGGGRLPPSQLM